MAENCEWFPDWSGETVVLVGSGPSAQSVSLDIAREKARVITINSSWKLAPWADLLYGCDYAWWKHIEGCPEFAGLKASSDIKAVREYGLHFAWCNRGTDVLDLSESGQIGWGGNSGFGALNLAAKFKVKKIVLVGFDLTVEYGLHWHGSHPKGLNNPTKNNVPRWRRAIDNAASKLTQAGIEVVNCSPISTLNNYPKMSFEDAFSLSECGVD